MKVRAYLALTAAAVLVPVVFFSTMALKMLLDAEREAALKSVQETVRASALIVDRELANAETALRVLGTSPHLQAGNFQNFYHQAYATNRHTGTWTVLFDRAGRQLVNTRVGFGTPLPRRSVPQEGLEAIEMQEMRVSNLLFSETMQHHLVSIDAPAPLDGGRRYVLAQAFVPEYFNLAFEHPGIPASWVIGIFDREGITIARSRNAADFVGKPTVPALMEAAGNAQEGVLRGKSLDGVEVYGVFTHSAMSGWIVAAGVPLTEIEASARRAVAVAGMGLLAAFALAAGVALLLGRRLAGLIAGAAASAAALGRGDAPEPAATGVAELDALHTALADAGGILWREKEARAIVEADRTKLLASEKEARQLAEQQNKAKDNFIAMLGHELRNPLNAISGAISVMEMKGAEEEYADRARAIIRRQSQHLGRIVDDLLDLSRMTSGKVLLDKRHINLAEAVRACISGLQAAGRTEGYVLNMYIAPAPVHADPTRLEQIISNLLTNAFKYTPSGGAIEVEVRTEAGEAVLVVNDSGIGIPADLLPQVFDVFVQGEDLLDRQQGGLGLGLALVRQLVMLHGGSVTAESAGTGRGSTFIVRLPLACSVEQTSSSTPSAAIQNACRVLLVEDNEDGRQMLSMILGLQGYQVLEASNGIDGIELAASEKPDVAVIDIGLPGIDGYEVARRLRANPQTRNIGLIALTGYGQETDRQSALDAGFDVHLAKPFDTERLLEAVNTCIERS
jgi:signal transduction histidine kinase/ActR/RegA family two-component response regulator